MIDEKDRIPLYISSQKGSMERSLIETKIVQHSRTQIRSERD